MPFTQVFAGIAVQDRDAAIEFYERLLGVPPTMLPTTTRPSGSSRAAAGCTCCATLTGPAGRS
jgi:predicted enzyme related to lactoylglutathione lyase